MRRGGVAGGCHGPLWYREALDGYGTPSSLSAPRSRSLATRVSFRASVPPRLVVLSICTHNYLLDILWTLDIRHKRLVGYVGARSRHCEESSGGYGVGSVPYESRPGHTLADSRPTSKVPNIVCVTSKNRSRGPCDVQDSRMPRMYRSTYLLRDPLARQMRCWAHISTLPSVKEIHVRVSNPRGVGEDIRCATFNIDEMVAIHLHDLSTIHFSEKDALVAARNGGVQVLR